MADQGKGTVTRLLHAQAMGDEAAFDQLVSQLYEELRRLARRQLANDRKATLVTTGLVHEAYLKLAGQDRSAWKERQRFFAIAAQAMRHIVVDLARKRGRQKRGGGAVVETLDEARFAGSGSNDQALAVHDALEKLGQVDARLAQVVECRYFAGLSEEEAATALGVSLRTTQRLWKAARVWLAQELAA